tara:strand:- start:354 stop:1742 length:1389 start_codon:yes stop_codon:yes gene_type:complete
MAQPWIKWVRGSKQENLIAELLGIKYKKEGGKYKVRYWTSTIHRNAFRKDNARKHLPVLDKFIRDRIKEYEDHQPVEPKVAKQYESDELLTAKQILKDWKITTPLLTFVKQQAEQEFNTNGKTQDISPKEAYKQYRVSKPLAHNSIPAAQKIFKDVFSPFFDMEMRRINFTDIDKQLIALWKSNDWSVDTFNKRVTGTSGFLKWCQSSKRRYISMSWPVSSLERMPEEEYETLAGGITKYFTPDQTNDLLHSATGRDTDKYQFDYMPNLATQFFAGPRPFETYRLPLENFNMEDNTVKLVKSKLGDNKHRLVKLKPNLKAIILPYWEAQGGRGLMLPPELRVKLEPLFYGLNAELAKTGKIRNKKAKREYDECLASIGGTFSQAFKRMAERLKLDWIRDGSRHSYGSYRYNQLFHQDNSDNFISTKNTLKEEMGTNVENLEKHYVGSGIKLAEVNQYFSVGL